MRTKCHFNNRIKCNIVQQHHTEYIQKQKRDETKLENYLRFESCLWSVSAYPIRKTCSCTQYSSDAYKNENEKLFLSIFRCRQNQTEHWLTDFGATEWTLQQTKLVQTEIKFVRCGREQWQDFFGISSCLFFACLSFNFVLGLVVFIVSLKEVLIVIGYLADDVLIQPFIIRQMDLEVNLRERHWEAQKPNRKCMTEITKKCWFVRKRRQKDTQEGKKKQLIAVLPVIRDCVIGECNQRQQQL